ncbi:endosomal transmembrane epsin interactor 1 isoform X2 [Tympanuchus pallidicinctus]|uniref:endosomal transmembrane epsin interactor 1 isoform X2 n=1 Tax=Tympanuchus pallidicinctus TaxID=109042 RepID=UPI00228736AF|nr:endosomal transmembrane epsin interactor 1 isoform X2 [Tympanuchus pallidicinctus]
MSLPVVLPGSCCPVPALAAGSPAAGTATQPPGSLPAAAAEPSLPPLRSRRVGCPRPRPAARSSPARRAPGAGLLPSRPLLSLGLLQLVLGCCMVALSFGALSLSGAPQVKNACPFWAGSSVILSGIIGLTTWKRPMILLVNLFVLLSVICVLLNLAGFILGCQGAQFVSSLPRCDLVVVGETKICFCCEEFNPAKCSEKENVLKLYPVKSCGAVHILLKDESQISTEEIEEQGRISDPEDFVPPVPPPSYFATFYSFTPRMSRRVLGSDVIPLPHIYGARIKGIEVFCPLDPPPPYEAVVNQIESEQESGLQEAGEEFVADSAETSGRQASQGEEVPKSPSRTSLPPSAASPTPAEVHRKAFSPLQKRSKSDPVLHCQLPQGPVLSCEAATQTEIKPQLNTVTLRNSLKARPLKSRPRSLVDYKSYIDTKLLVARFLEQSSCSMTPDIHELVENIKCVLKSDEEHMAEAITSATFLEQVMAPAQQDVGLRAHVLPFRRHPGLLHLESCGDLSTFTTGEDQLAERRTQRTEHERPHSLIGVVRETVL